MISFCYIRRSFFEEHANFIKLLDIGNTDKQSKRAHLCVHITNGNNNFYIPLRNHLGADVRKFGRIGHSVPTKERKSAGLDYRYALIVNDPRYLEEASEQKIPRRQYKKIQQDFDLICSEFNVYLEGYIKAAKRKRHDVIPLYKESSLVNFHRELGIDAS